MSNIACPFCKSAEVDIIVPVQLMFSVSEGELDTLETDKSTMFERARRSLKTDTFLFGSCHECERDFVLTRYNMS